MATLEGEHRPTIGTVDVEERSNGVVEYWSGGFTERRFVTRRQLGEGKSHEDQNVSACVY